MSILPQGDVGCGKTVIALVACIEVIESGYQVSCCGLLLWRTYISKMFVLLGIWGWLQFIRQ